MFLADLLLVYIYFNYGNDVREKANSSDFSFKSSQRQLTTTHLAQELLTNVQQWWFKKFTD